MICSFQGKLGESYNKKLFLSMPLWDNMRYRSLTYYHRSSDDDDAKDVSSVTYTDMIGNALLNNFNLLFNRYFLFMCHENTPPMFDSFLIFHCLS